MSLETFIMYSLLAQVTSQKRALTASLLNLFAASGLLTCYFDNTVATLRWGCRVKIGWPG